MTYQDKIIRELLRKINVYSDNKEVYISKLVNMAIYILVNKNPSKTSELDQEKIMHYAWRIKAILNDLYEDYLSRSHSTNTIAEDIEYVGVGYNSITFRVGDNVIKLGNSEYNYQSPQIESNYLVPTYLKEGYEVGNKTHFMIEVQPFVDTSNITYDDLYKVYSNIRNLGYIWNDPKEENLGKVIGIAGCKIDGITYLPSKDYQKGYLVIIDLEDIVYVGEETSDLILDEISMMSYNRNVYVFETRWLEERLKRGLYLI